MIKCEVVATRVSLVVAEGSIVYVDDRQYEIARQFLKPVLEAENTEEPVVEVKKATRTRKTTKAE